jgi:aspartyl protease family protein
MKGFVALALMLVAFLLIVGEQVADTGPLSPAGEPTAAPSTSAAMVGRFAGEGIVIERGKDGQFHFNASVNGTETRFLVDTGADTVALTMADAEAAGVQFNPNGFVPILRTASGEGYGTMVTLERLQVGDTELRNVGAVVVRDLGVSLLGQSVLGRMGRVELQGDRMVLETG